MIEKRIDYIDDPKDTYEQYLQKAMKYNFRCIFANPETIDIAKEMLKGSDIIIAGAIDFPLGVLTLEEKLNRFQLYADLGFKEIDYVLCQKHVENCQYEDIYKEMDAVHRFCIAHDIREKVIVEMCKLKDDDAKRKICEIANQVKPSFLKTSTGKSWKGAQLEDVKLMKECLCDDIKIKAAGGIKTYEQAKAFFKEGADVIGASAGIAIVEESRDE